MTARVIDACRACGGRALVEVANLGEQYLSDFRDDEVRPPRYPLVAYWCAICSLLQLGHTAPAAEMYHPRYSFKSGVNPAIAADLADVVRYALAAKPDAEAWLDIASNDGTLLAAVPPAIYRVGVDPLAQFAEEAARHADRIVVSFFRPEFLPKWHFDVITSVSMFYDVDDPNAFVAGVRRVLAPDGVWVIQQNYVGSMLTAGSVDNISHEHLTYWSLRSLSRLLGRHGLEVVDVQLNPINGGCFRTLVCRKGDRPVQPSVAALAAAERAQGLERAETYWRFADRARDTLIELAALVAGINDRGERVYVYGASTRGGTLWQAAGLTERDLPFVVDRNPAKVGRRMSALGSLIISEEQARVARPQYLLVGPWWFADDFSERESEYLERGGKMIIPLPHLKVVGR
ncbi:class I SAM-dependent methyltransferase [Rhizomonospora bruguierae]|uniref:class I SAM-dependent methyltransferase n=1 Tax=Rhizomonospora bruguierae TaxID=1581705 RepID=UPI001BCE342C|nr:class I SAM-dependent methyltransferase [Micromonospora sp. NBRC 107566]